MRRGDAKFFSRFQACCLNFEKTLCSLFGERLSLSNELSLALQFVKLDFEQLVSLEKFDIPEEIAALDARLCGTHSEEEQSDLEYQFRVVYTFQSTAKSRAHIQFVRPDTAEGKEICHVLEKRVVADTLYPHKPRDVCAIVSKRMKKRFTPNNNLKAAYLYKVRPKTGSKQPENTDKEYCIYHPLYKSYSYSKSWIKRLCEIVADDQEFAKIK